MNNKSYRSKLGLSLLAAVFALQAHAQNVGVGTNVPNASAKLDIVDANRGLLIPRVALVAVNNGTTPVNAPATGLLVYNTNATVTGGSGVGFYYWNGSIWVKFGVTGESWLLTGNAGTNPTNNFLGTTDAQALVFRTNNLERMRVLANGQVVIGSTTPFAGDVFSAYSGAGNYAINAYSSGANGIGVYAQTTGTGSNAGLFLGNNAANTQATIYARTIAGSGAVAELDADGTGMGVWVTTAAANPNGKGIEVSVNGSGANARGVDVYMAAANTGLGYGGFHNGNGRVANFQQQNTTTTEPTIFASAAAPGGRVINAQNNATNSRASVGFFSQASTGLTTAPPASPTDFTTAAAVWGQSSGIRSGVFLASGASNNTIALNAQFNNTTANDAIGVYGRAAPQPNWGYGVVGQGNWYGVFANGDMGASGTKTFMIDHPLDPENKYLKHYSMESPEVLNVYRGNVVLDANGQATVQLPNYFHAININCSYNLTPIGAPANLYIESEVDAQGRFKIAGGRPGMKVSWYVHAERNDAYIQANPDKKAVEVVKRPHEQGLYLQPEAHGQPEEKGLFFKHKAQPQQVLPTISAQPTEPRKDKPTTKALEQR
jgi:hypothetical protein